LRDGELRLQLNHRLLITVRTTVTDALVKHDLYTLFFH